MIPRALLAFALALGLCGCGVRSDLVLPDGSAPSKDQKDASKPPIKHQGQ